jgi:hypothetical protein
MSENAVRKGREQVVREPTVHLHWAWKKPELLKTVSTGVSICCERGVPYQQLTAVPKYTTCARCRAAYKREIANANARAP